MPPKPPPARPSRQAGAPAASHRFFGGVPARLIRYRFSEEQISRLLASEWFLKPPHQLDHDALNRLCGAPQQAQTAP